MKNNHYLSLLCACFLSFILNSQISNAQNSVLVLKGNVLTPVSSQGNSTVKNNSQSSPPIVNAPPTAPKATVVKKATPKSNLVGSKTPISKAKPVIVKAPASKPAPVAKAVAVKKANKKQIDYIKRVQSVHNLVCKRIPQKLLDSIADVNHLMLDSIRMEIFAHRDKDSISFLKTALSAGVSDSLTILGINSLVNSATGGEPTQSTGAVNAYCIDLSSQAPMDSVKVNVISHDSLIVSAFSGNDGFCKLAGLKPGEYSLAFSKNNYTPFSDRWVKVTAGNVTYLEMPLSETPRFYLPKFSPQIWAMIIVGVISVFVLIYSIIRRLGRVA